MKKVKKPPPLTNSNQMQRKRERGRRREHENKAGERPLEKIVAFVCFGSSRVRCAGWCGVKL